MSAPSLASYLSTCLAWVTLPGDESPAIIALEVSETRKPPNRRQGVTLWEGSMIGPMLIAYESFFRGRRSIVQKLAGAVKITIRPSVARYVMR